MDSESFYGVTLSEKEPLTQCEVAESDKESMCQKLIIKQICLGVDAKDGEFNVVQAEVRGYEKDSLKIPIAVLKVGETRVLRPNLEFPSASVTLKLIQGTGPVHVYGQLMVSETSMEYEWYGDEEGEDEDYDDDAQPVHTTNGRNTIKKK